MGGVLNIFITKRLGSAMLKILNPKFPSPEIRVYEKLAGIHSRSDNFNLSELYEFL